jgi:hypothetical protein
VPDWDNTESRESDEDAAWRDLVARFEEPTTATVPLPWPERENVPRPQATRGAEGTDGPPEADGAKEAQGTSAVDDLDGTGGKRGTEGARGIQDDGDARRARKVEGIRGFDDEGVRGTFGAEGGLGAEGRAGAQEPDVIQAARRERNAAADGTRARRIRARKAPSRPRPEDDEEHFIPPEPPPLPKLDPIAKGAWAALFGGPGYLVVATAIGWSIPGIAAFCAVAAFVTGFAILVLHMNEPSGPGPGGPDDGDGGAVV